MYKWFGPIVIGAVILTVAWMFSARAQTGGGALVVTTCGTPPLAFTVGATRQLTVNTNGQVCQ
jgi:hypothetical protein